MQYETQKNKKKSDICEWAKPNTRIVSCGFHNLLLTFKILNVHSSALHSPYSGFPISEFPSAQQIPDSTIHIPEFASG